MSVVHATGNPTIDRVLAAVIARVEALLPAAQLGYYLHGSWGAGAARPLSDVDVLALASGPLSPAERAQAKEVASELAATAGVPLDFHLHPVAALINDPYVDLLRTGRFLYGVDVRPALPQPTLDALAREAVLVACLSAVDARSCERVRWPLEHPNPSDPFFGRLSDDRPPGIAKTLTWLTSARLASTHRYAPTSAADALRAIEERNDSDAAWITGSVALLRQLPVIADAPPQAQHAVQQVCEELLALENTTLASVRQAVEAGVLGARCAAVLNTYVTFPDDAHSA